MFHNKINTKGTQKKKQFSPLFNGHMYNMLGKVFRCTLQIVQTDNGRKLGGRVFWALSVDDRKATSFSLNSLYCSSHVWPIVRRGEQAA